MYAITQLKSTYDPYYHGRQWSFQCCKIITDCNPQCITSKEKNELKRNLFFMVPYGSYLTGVKSEPNIMLK